ncbi:helix-turn-helix domain-containing protein [Acinetobacter beijerinckii]|uniref:helix-turn-helix domain-containing protein n=1 Tax=Acinetobacter beijerinckii TaxID=262668 RepID=UPI002406DD05|nr:helix-turn-helix transcriptional regulator [Acinetobacter beijerinckii]
MSSSIGSRIRNIRGNESRALFSEKFGIGTATLQRYENNERSPDIDFLIKLQMATGYSFDYLVYGKEASLPVDEALILEKYRQANSEIKNKMLMLLLADEKTTDSVVNSPLNSGNETHLSGKNNKVENPTSTNKSKTKVKAEKIGNVIGDNAKIKMKKMEF